MIKENEWLVVIDRQRVFCESNWSTWACSNNTYNTTTKPFKRLAKSFGSRVIYTRYIAPTKPVNAWIDYFKEWKQFLVSADDQMYDFTPETAELAKNHPVISRDTFGKWCDELKNALKGSSTITICGVATDCCVLATALAAADSGISVRIAADACAGSTPENHKLALDTMKLFTPLITVSDTNSIIEK